MSEKNSFGSASFMQIQPIDKHTNKSESEKGIEFRSLGDGHHTSIINGGYRIQQQRPVAEM